MGPLGGMLNAVLSGPGPRPPNNKINLCMLPQVATLGYGDITPSTAAETAVDCFIVVTGVLMFGIILGSIAEQVSNSSREARQAQVIGRALVGASKLLGLTELVDMYMLVVCG